MSLFEVNFATKIISESDNAFEVDGMMNPTFYNEGKTTVRINNQVVLPTEYYRVDMPNCVLKGKFNIKFTDEVGKVNQVIINYGMVVGPYTDPSTGATIGVLNRSGFSQTCN